MKINAVIVLLHDLLYEYYIMNKNSLFNSDQTNPPNVSLSVTASWCVSFSELQKMLIKYISP